MNLVHVPKPETQKGTPAGLVFHESLHVPWRTLHLQGQVYLEGTARPSDETTKPFQPGEAVRLTLEGPLFQGALQGLLSATEGVAWGLPEWRREVGPQGFQDAKAEEVAEWVKGQVGGKALWGFQTEPKRHYALPRVRAWEGVLMALKAWGVEAVMHELDGGVLYAGLEERSPHYGVVHRVGEEVAWVRPLSPGRYGLRMAPLPALRVLHLLRVDHPAYRGGLRVEEHRLVLSPKEAYHEVIGREE
ncbi:hypothetical protein [Thermus scotoductus]|uniref:Uncharacterized protein n=1 Tax=Thermus scotoductus TaxID=37636 RepID=A0A430RZ31_THESC|nr:hypothetical protein [Thermus scotoductus]RTG95908.1 hypothetical protein CSW51_05905 [Thermus scotoductus]RTH26353.1 hypothetical protein CSW38_05970 [Thermus scotoductus]